MVRKKTKVIPKNVLAQEALRRKYIEEPWPQKLVLAKSILDKDNNIRVMGSVTGLFYNLSCPFLYIDERDLEGLGDMVTLVAKEEIANANAIRGNTGNLSAPDAITNAGKARATGEQKCGRPRKSSRSKADDDTDTGKTRGVSAGDNDG